MLRTHRVRQGTRSGDIQEHLTVLDTGRELDPRPAKPGEGGGRTIAIVYPMQTSSTPASDFFSSGFLIVAFWVPSCWPRLLACGLLAVASPGSGFPLLMCPTHLLDYFGYNRRTSEHILFGVHKQMIIVHLPSPYSIAATIAKPHRSSDISDYRCLLVFATHASCSVDGSGRVRLRGLGLGA